MTKEKTNQNTINGYCLHNIVYFDEQDNPEVGNVLLLTHLLREPDVLQKNSKLDPFSRKELVVRKNRYRFRTVSRDYPESNGLDIMEYEAYPGPVSGISKPFGKGNYFVFKSKRSEYQNDGLDYEDHAKLLEEVGF